MIQHVSRQAALLGAHTAGGRVYHVRQKKKQTQRQPCYTTSCTNCTARPNWSLLTSAIHTTWNWYAVLGARQAYAGLNDRFAVMLKNAAQDLFTFVRYPDMEPTNNESEHMLRKVAIHRRMCQKLITVGGKIMFGTIMTCLLMCDKMRLNWFEKLSKAFWAT